MPFIRKVGSIILLLGIVSLASPKSADGTEWLSLLLLFVGIFLYLLPDDLKEFKK